MTNYLSDSPMIKGERVYLASGDFKGNYGVITKASENGVCGVVKLDSGVSIVTMDYNIQKLLTK